MVLGKEELQTDSSEPGEEAGVAASNPARDIPEQNETDNLEKNQIRTFKPQPIKVVFLNRCSFN